MLSVMPSASGRLEAAELPTGATLTVLADPVEVAPASSVDGAFLPAVPGQSLVAGDIVRTGDSGMALLTFFDGSESQLSAGSQVQIEQADYAPAPRIALLQTNGVTINRVIPLPPGGTFRTDTPEATGLVRGTSYVVSVGASEDDTSADPSATSIALLTDRDGHVGHVQMVPTQDLDQDETMDLVSAGDVGAVTGPACTAGHLDAASLAALESSARDLHDVDGGQHASDLARKAMHAAATTAPAPGANMAPAVQTGPLVSSAPAVTSDPVKRPTQYPSTPTSALTTARVDGQTGVAAAAAPAPPAPTPVSAKPTTDEAAAPATRAPTPEPAPAPAPSATAPAPAPSTPAPATQPTQAPAPPATQAPTQAPTRPSYPSTPSTKKAATPAPASTPGNTDGN